MSKVSERRPIDQSSRQQLILNEALQLFTELPYESVSIDDVCERAGVAHGLVSYYFGGKQGLLAAAAQAAWTDFVDYQRPSESDTTAAERIRGYLRRHFEYVSDHPDRYKFMITSEARDGALAEIMKNARERALVDVVASLGCPENPPPQLRTALISWGGYVDSATLDWLQNEDVDLDFVTDICVQTLVASVRSIDGRPFDAEEELSALEQVSGPPLA